MLAVVLGGVACLPRQAVGLARRGRLDGLGVAVLVVLAVSGLLSLLSGDARVLVVKDAIWPLAAGLVAAGSCLRGKPVSFFILRPVLTQGRAENRPFWDQVWARGSAFRHCLRVLAAGWAVILLTAGAAELLLAGSLPISAAARPCPPWCRRSPSRSCLAAPPPTASGRGWASAGRSRR